MRHLRDESETRALGAELAGRLGPGDLLLLDGLLGAGKTTLVRGLLEALGVREPVRSPTYNLIQLFATQPPVLHADLYRVASAAGLGLEDYLDSHLCIVEWPDRAQGLVDPDEAWRISIEFEGAGRLARVHPPGGSNETPAGV